MGGAVMSTRTAFTLAALAALAAFSAAPAGAQPPPPSAERPAPSPEALDRARELFKAGSDAYRDGEYAVAIEAFEAALDLTPRASVMFALAQSLRLQYFVDGQRERLERAIELYRRYGDSADADPALQVVALRHLAALITSLQELNRRRDATVGRLIVSTGVEGATVRVGERDPVEAPATLELPPGLVQVRVEAPRFQPQTVETMVIGGDSVALNLDLVPIPGRLVLDSPEGAEVIVDGRAQGAAPVPPIELAPGVHRVAVLASGRRAFVTTVEIAAAREVTLETPLELTGQRILAWGMFSVTGLLVAGTAVTAGLALDREAKADALLDRWEANGLNQDEAAAYADRVAERDAWVEGSIALGAAALVAGGIGAALWLFDQPTAPTGPVLTPTVTPDGTGAALMGSMRW